MFRLCSADKKQYVPRKKRKNMDKNKENLFLLLSAALWEKGNVAQRVKDVDWNAVRRLAMEQYLMGVVADTFPMLSEAQCGKEERWKWMGYVLNLQKHNQRMNVLVGKLFRKFHDMGLQPVLMKGQAFAANYPEPLHRHCGDIDIYFKNRTDCAKAVAWAGKVDPAAAESSDNKRERRHFTFSVEKNIVELHYFMCLFENKRLNCRLQEVIDEEFARSEPFLVDIAGEQTETVPPTLSVLHQIIHIARHLLEAGIGLRQLCDLALYLDRHYDELDKVRLQKCLEELELQTVAEALGHILVNNLGLDACKLPFGTNGQYAGFILNEIFEGGNFGKKKTEYQKKKNGWSRKLQSVMYFYRRCKTYRPLFPSEAKSYFRNKICLNIKLLATHHC